MKLIKEKDTNDNSSKSFDESVLNMQFKNNKEALYKKYSSKSLTEEDVAAKNITHHLIEAMSSNKYFMETFKKLLNKDKSSNKEGFSSLFIEFTQHMNIIFNQLIYRLKQVEGNEETINSLKRMPLYIYSESTLPARKAINNSKGIDSEIIESILHLKFNHAFSILYSSLLINQDESEPFALFKGISKNKKEELLTGQLFSLIYILNQLSLSMLIDTVDYNFYEEREKVGTINITSKAQLRRLIAKTIGENGDEKDIDDPCTKALKHYLFYWELPDDLSDFLMISKKFQLFVKKIELLSQQKFSNYTTQSDITKSEVLSKATRV